LSVELLVTDCRQVNMCNTTTVRLWLSVSVLVISAW